MKVIDRVANQIVDALPPQDLKRVAADGYAGPLPDAVDEHDAPDVARAVQDLAICIVGGAVR